MTEENKDLVKEPSKTWAWDPEAKIEITGIEYSILQKSLTFPHQLSALFEPASAIAHTIFQRMVDSGIAREQGETAPTQEYIPTSEVKDEHVPHVD